MTGVHFPAGPGSFVFVLYSVQTGFKTDKRLLSIEYYILAEKNVVTAHLHVVSRVRCGTIFVLFHSLSHHFVPVLQNYSEKSFLTKVYSLLDIKINLLLTTGSQLII